MGSKAELRHELVCQAIRVAQVEGGIWGSNSGSHPEENDRNEDSHKVIITNIFKSEMRLKMMN